jgi:hypothetical protein
MRALVMVFLCLFSVVSFAQESRLKIKPAEPVPLLKLYILDFEMRYEKGSDLEWAERKPLNFAVAVQLKQFDFVMEYASFQQSTGNTTLGIDRDHKEVLAWSRWHFVNKNFSETRVSLYGGLGVGGYEEEVTTSTPGSSQSDKSGMKWMSGLSAGIEMQVPVTTSLGFVGAIEGRVLTAADFEPNPLGSGVVRLGLFLNL